MTHFYRKNRLSCQQWQGAGIVLFGTLLIAGIDVETNDKPLKNTIVGLSFILAKTFLGVVADMLSEFFMKECDYPPLLLLGMVNSYSSALGLLFYSTVVVPSQGFQLHSSLSAALESPQNIAFTLGLVLLIFATGVFGIFATFKTSSVTKTVWKGMRGLFVWIFALIIYYGIDDRRLGEPWQNKGSPILLGGFAIMIWGIYLYSEKPQPRAHFKRKKQQTDQSSPSHFLE